MHAHVACMLALPAVRSHTSARDPFPFAAGWSSAGLQPWATWCVVHASAPPLDARNWQQRTRAPPRSLVVTDAAADLLLHVRDCTEFILCAQALKSIAMLLRCRTQATPDGGAANARFFASVRRARHYDFDTIDTSAGICRPALAPCGVTSTATCCSVPTHTARRLHAGGQRRQGCVRAGSQAAGTSAALMSPRRMPWPAADATSPVRPPDGCCTQLQGLLHVSTLRARARSMQHAAHMHQATFIRRPLGNRRRRANTTMLNTPKSATSPDRTHLTALVNNVSNTPRRHD